LSVMLDCALYLLLQTVIRRSVLSSICGKLVPPPPMSGLLDQLVVLAAVALEKKAALSPEFVAVMDMVMLVAAEVDPWFA